MEQQDFTQQGITQYLREHGAICGVIDTAKLSDALGTISTRMLRKYALEGKLKPLDITTSYYVFRIEDVANWLLKYPQYLFKKPVDNSDLTAARVDELATLARNYVRGKFRGLRRYMDEEDCVMEVLASICKKRRTSGVTDATLVFRALCTLYRKVSRRVDTVTIDPQKIEQTYAGDNDDEN